MLCPSCVQQWDDLYFNKENIFPPATFLRRGSIHSEEGQAFAVEPLSRERRQPLGVILDTSDEALAYEMEMPGVDTSEDPLAAYRETTWESHERAMDRAQRNDGAGSHKLAAFWCLLDVLKVRTH